MNKKHKCHFLLNASQGDWTCVSEHNLIKKIPAKVANFRYRNKELSQLLELMLG